MQSHRVCNSHAVCKKWDFADFTLTNAPTLEPTGAPSLSGGKYVSSTTWTCQLVDPHANAHSGSAASRPDPKKPQGEYPISASGISTPTDHKILSWSIRSMRLERKRVRVLIRASKSSFYFFPSFSFTPYSPFFSICLITIVPDSLGYLLTIFCLLAKYQHTPNLPSTSPFPAPSTICPYLEALVAFTQPISWRPRGRRSGTSFAINFGRPLVRLAKRLRAIRSRSPG